MVAVPIKKKKKSKREYFMYCAAIGHVGISSLFRLPSTAQEV